MKASDYNRYLAAIKAARDLPQSDAREVLRRIYTDMVKQYGANEDEVQYLFRQFHLHI